MRKYLVMVCVAVYALEAAWPLEGASQVSVHMQQDFRDLIRKDKESSSIKLCTEVHTHNVFGLVLDSVLVGPA